MKKFLLYIKTPFSLYIKCLKKSFRYDRAAREEFSSFVLLNSIIAQTLIVLFGENNFISVLFFTIQMPPGISVFIRRSNDINKSGYNLFGFIFQPSELLKIATVIYVASFLSRKQDQRQSFQKGYLPILFICMFISGILLKQPDFGCTVTILATVLIMLFIAKMNINLGNLPSSTPNTKRWGK